MTIHGRTDAELEEPLYWAPGTKNKITGKKLMLGEIESRKKRVRQSTRWLQSITDSKVMGLRKLWAI